MTLEKEQFLGKAKTASYRPSAVSWPLQLFGHRPWFTYGDLEIMRRDPEVSFGIRILSSFLQIGKWDVVGKDVIVNKFVNDTLSRLWSNTLQLTLRNLYYGNSAGEPLYKMANGQIIYDKMRELFPMDVQPLEKDGMLCGIQVKGNTTGNLGTSLWLLAPRYFWCPNEPAFGSLYGRSRLAGAWEPWQEKRGRHGAIDIRRLWAVKNAYHSGIMRHPVGSTVDPVSGQVVSNQAYAREVIEKLETGGTLVLPSSHDEHGYEWDYDEPRLNGNFEELLKYPRDLDQEIQKGLGIPPEVIQAATSGSGWSGRTVPFLVFLASMDGLMRQTTEAYDSQIIRPLVEVNFGPGQTYEIKPISLVDLPQVSGGNPAQGGQPPVAPPVTTPTPQTPPPPPPSEGRQLADALGLGYGDDSEDELCMEVMELAFPDCVAHGKLFARLQLGMTHLDTLSSRHRLAVEAVYGMAARIRLAIEELAPCIDLLTKHHEENGEPFARDLAVRDTIALLSKNWMVKCSNDKTVRVDDHVPLGALVLPAVKEGPSALEMALIMMKQAKEKVR